VKYPVVYVLDGGVQLKAVETVHSYYWGGFIPEMVIVGISNGSNRTRDLTTSTIEDRRSMPYSQESGGAENFFSFIEGELIPHIEENYPVTNYRTLIGHSYAGLFTINALINHTEIFKNYLAIDPSLEWDDQKLMKESREVISKTDFEGRSLYISMSGQLHLQNSQITIDKVMDDSSEYTLFSRSIIEFSTMISNMQEDKINFQWKYYERDLHGTVVLPSILDGLIFLFDWYPIEQTDKFNSPGTPKEEIVQLIRNREKKLKDHFGYFVPPFEEELLTMLGYMNLEWENTGKSLAMFQLAAEYFPKSANVYDSLADFYESQEDYANALKYVSKAYELSGNEFHLGRINEFKEKL
jgi:hypothetical protein